MKKFFFIFLLLFVVFSCQKETGTQTVTEVQKMENLIVQSDFDWKTTRDITFTITGNENGTVQLLSPQGLIYHKAFIIKNKPYEVLITLPSKENIVKIKFLNQEVEVSLISNNVIHKV